MQIEYTKGHKYQLSKNVAVILPRNPEKDIHTHFIDFSAYSGLLYIRRGYAWDGPSGLTIDTPSGMPCSLVHDALYELMWRGLLPPDYRSCADTALYNIAIEDGMWEWRAGLWYRVVRKVAGFAADPINRRKIIIAP